MINKSDESHFGAQRFRNLTIRDLFLLTVAIAPFVSVYSWMAKEFFEDETSSALQSVFVLVQSSMCGIFVSALFWFAEAKKTHGKYFLHPGYWLITILGLYALAQLLPLLTFALLQNKAGDGSEYALIFIAALAFSLLGWVVTLSGFIKNTGWWKLFFLLLLVPTMLIQFISAALISPQQLIPVSVFYQCLVGFILLIPVASDIKGAVSRDWIHWLGVSTALLMMFILPFANYLVFVLT